MTTEKICNMRNKIIHEFTSISYKNGFNTRTVFEDFCLISMASFHNILYTLGKIPVPGCYKNNYEELEQEFERQKTKYGDQIFQTFADILGTIALCTRRDYFDYLGEIYMQINANSKVHGQFFTPSHICEFMAKIISGGKNDFEDQYAEQGFVRFSDPCCGSGAMAIGYIKDLEEQGIKDLDIKLYIELQDIDVTCVRMAFLNMTIFGVSSRIILGNSLAPHNDFPFYDTPFLQMALMQGFFRKPQDANENRIDKISETATKTTDSLPMGQLSLF